MRVFNMKLGDGGGGEGEGRRGGGVLSFLNVLLHGAFGALFRLCRLTELLQRLDG